VVVLGRVVLYAAVVPERNSVLPPTTAAGASETRRKTIYLR